MRTDPQPASSATTSRAAATKHGELSSTLRRAIESGQFKAGDRLPTEAQFVASTPYSLGTVQRAIRSLVEEGLVVRKPKLGTFVASPRRMINKPWHFRFLDVDRKTALPVYPTAIARVRIRQRGPWSDYLGAPLLRIDRLVNVNDEFTAFSRFFVDPNRFPVFEQVDLKALNGENFRALLNRQLGAPIKRISHRVYASRPPSELARKMGVRGEQTCTVIEIAAASKQDDFVYFQELTVPPSAHRLELADPDSDHHFA